MSRIVKAPEVRRQELIGIALKQFMENGYEKTSIRSILKEADGEIGMFYHYFKSKNEIYEAALEKYNEKYIESIAEIANASDLDFKERLNKMLSYLPGSISEYRLMYSEKVNPEIMGILLFRTLVKILPLIEQIIMEGIKNNAIVSPVSNVHLLGQFILFGMSAIIHDSEVTSMEEKLAHIKDLISKVLDCQV